MFRASLDVLLLHISPKVLRFLGAGAGNTVVTYLLYLGLIRVINYNIAYAICYVVGIVFSYWLNLRFVFKTSGSLTKFVLYPVVYLMQFLFGILILNLIVQQLHMPKEYAPIAIIFLTLPVTYLLSKAILEQDGDDKRSR